MVLWNRGLAHQKLQQQTGTRRFVDAIAHVLWRVIVHKVRGEAAHVQHLFTSLWVNAHHGVFSRRVLLCQLGTCFKAHDSAKGMLNAVACTQTFDFLFHIVVQVGIGLNHVDPNGVTANRGALNATQHTTHGWVLAPQTVAVVIVFVVLALFVAINLHQAGMLRVTARHRMVFKVTKAPCKGHVLSTGDVLVSQENHAMLQQSRLDFIEEVGVTRSVTQVDARNFSANGRG